MASFFTKGTVERATKVSAIHPKDFLKENPSSEDYDRAGFEFFQSVLKGLKEESIEDFVSVVRKYCDSYKVTGKDGNQYCDLALYGSYGKRALGAVYGDGNLGGVLYTLAQGFDKLERRDRLAKLWAERAGAKPKASATVRKVAKA